MLSTSVSIQQRFYAGLSNLAYYHVNVAGVVDSLIADRPLQEIHTSQQAIAYGIYLHQHRQIADFLFDHDFSESELVLMQAIAQVFQIGYPLDLYRYYAELAQSCQHLQIISALDQMYHWLNKGHSIGTVKVKISDPILLGIYLFLYTPYSWQDSQAICSSYCLDSTVRIISSSLVSLHLGYVPTPKLEIENISDRLFNYWSGVFAG